MIEVVKRDGNIVEYDRDKIIMAIGKANQEVPVEEQITRNSECLIKK